jgi:hypothetical protein
MRALVLLALTACGVSGATPVRATLADGQVIVGQVETPTLRLDGALGRLDIPLDDVGEVVPMRGDLEASGGYVRVWLRNGSELVGQWAEPELEMGVRAGGRTVPVALPMDDLRRFQLTGGALWPEGAVYRVRTAAGDDLFVDADDTRLVLRNELGTFEPFLSECATAIPVGSPSGPWRVQLVSGTVLVGALAADGVDLALPMGPDAVRVPPDLLASLTRQDWGERVARQSVAAAPRASHDAPVGREPASTEALSMRMEPADPARTRAPELAAAPWFDSAAYHDAKR